LGTLIEVKIRFFVFRNFDFVSAALSQDCVCFGCMQSWHLSPLFFDWKINY